MSADNGIYIASFPDGTFRVAYAFDSVVNELDSHYYTPEMYKETVESIWGTSTVHTDFGEAVADAGIRLHEVGYTEYGIMEIQMVVNFGAMKPVTPVPALPEGACPHCSDLGGMTTFHGEGKNLNGFCRDPKLPYNILVKAIRAGATGVMPEVVTRIILEALAENDYQLVRTENK